MHLIVIVAALLLERALGQLRRWREVDGFARYIAAIERSRLGRRWLAQPLGVLVILPPVAGLGLLQWAVAEYLWVVAEMALGVAVLVFTFGPRDLWEDVYGLAAARSQADHDAARARAVALSRRATGAPAADIGGVTLVGAVLVQGHERVLAVLLWFVVAGPAGALFYRSVRELPALADRGTGSPALARTAEYAHGLAMFVPARLIATAYGLVGNSRRALAGWREARATVQLSGAASWRLLSTVGRGALALPDDPQAARYQRGFNDTLLEALGLISRALLVVLAGLALLTIVGLLR